MTKNKLMVTSLTNHVAIVLDASSSMSGLRATTVKVFDGFIKTLQEQSKSLNQETRISLYVFADNVNVPIFDMDVMRVPSIKEFYSPDGMTALCSGVVQAKRDLDKVPELYTDHAFLLIVITDGEENASTGLDKSQLRTLLANLADNWTVVAQVPNQMGKKYMKDLGFPGSNIEIWDTSEKGMESAVELTTSSVKTYMTNRSAGIRSTNNFYSADTSNISKSTAKANLEELKPSEYEFLRVNKDSVIRPFVESWFGAGSYRPGSAYYELVKTETVQANKLIIIKHKKDGRAYGGANARTMLGLGDHEIKVKPGQGDWTVYVQSTSINRKLPAGTSLIVMK